MRLPSRARKRHNSKMSIPAPASGHARRNLTLSAALLAAVGSFAPFYDLPLRAQAGPQQPRVSLLPATPPTALPQQPIPHVPGTLTGSNPADCTTPPCPAAGDDGRPKPTKPHRASVNFSDGQLTIAANDSSLHQILRSISTQTGMKISGGVEEQRVFGTYGPSDPASILATLLDGTGVNMLLTDGPDHIPSSLVLTQRTGGPPTAPITPDDEKIGADELAVVPAPAPEPVPPPAPVVAATPAPQSHPAQPQSVQQVVTPPVTSTPVSVPQPANNVLGSPDNVTPTASQIPTTNSVPIDALPTPSTTVQTQQGIVDTPNPPPAGSAPTPDSIYQQLLQLQKAKAAANTNGNPPATPPPAATPPQ
jgi:hypothetical protein